MNNYLGFFMFLCLVNSGHQFEYYPLSIWPDRRPKCSHPPCSGSDVSSFHSSPFSATSHIKCKFLLAHQSEIRVKSLDQNQRNFRYRYQTADPDTFKNERISGDDRVTLRKFFHETKTKYVNLYNCAFPPTQHNGITPTQ